MTTENKIIEEMKSLYWDSDVQELAKDPCVVDAMINMFIKTVKKYEDKFRWHDLAENPDDLPESGDRVEAVYLNNEDDVIDISYLYWNQDGWNKPLKVLCWRYCDLFDGRTW